MTPRTFHLTTFGCQMNVRDSEIMTRLLEGAGMRAVADVREADVAVVNTCAVREHAESRALSFLGRLRPWREAAPDRVLVLAGCVAEAQGRRLLERFPHLDLVVGPARLLDLARLIAAAGDGDAPRVVTGPAEAATVPELSGEHPASFRSWLKIMEGCDHGCTYCIVPEVRGRERSRPFAEIVTEAEGLAAQGVVELGLLGQTVNAYGKGLGPDGDFAALLRRLAAITGLRRIRFTSPHPSYHHDRVLQAMADCPSIAPHLHLPVQSGSDAILKAMRRGYTTAHYLGILGRARALVPGLAVTTDLIVGFPGETGADFEATLALVRAADLDGAYTFKFSPRPGTAAAGLPGQVAEAEKEARLARVNAFLDEGSRRHHAALVGTTVEALVEGPRKGSQLWQGRLASNRLVFFEPDAGTAVGTFRAVEITEAGSWTLTGRLVGARTRPGVACATPPPAVVP
ncbi:MAG: tRNA (N6-isopentenyl adenosine(37)-C2)-methylthiotransferase MiaB [Candidatus Coatesbacteria bacterium]